MLNTIKYLIFFLLKFAIVLNLANAQVLDVEENLDTESPSPAFLTPEERQWVKDHPVLRATSKIGGAPFEFIRADEAAGFSVDYLNLVAANVGLEIEYVTDLTWSASLEQLKSRNIDISHNIALTDDREEFLDFSSPYIELRPAIFGRKTDGPVTSVEQLVGKRILVISGWAALTQYRNKYPDLLFEETTDHTQAFLSISRGEYDFFILQRPVGNYHIEVGFMNDLAALGDLQFLDIDVMQTMRLASRNDWPQLKSILSKGMLVITDEQQQELSRKWLLPVPIENELNLTHAEQQWLLNNPILKVSADPTIAPVEFIDNEGRVSGIIGSYLKIVEEKLDIKFEWAGTQDFNESMEKILNKESHVISAVTPSESRKSFLDFTETIMSLDSVIFAKEGGDVFIDMEGLSGRKIAQVTNFQSTTKLKADYPEIEVIETDTIADALRLVSTGQADAYIGSVPITSYIIAIEGLTNLGAVGTTPMSNTLAMGIRSDLPELSGAIRKAIASIPANKKAEINRQWMVLQKSPAQDYTLVWQIGLAALCLIVLVLTWNYSLRQEVTRRKSSEARFKQIAETVDGLFFILHADLNGVDYISPNFESWTGHTCEELYENYTLWRDLIHPNDINYFNEAIGRILTGEQVVKIPNYRIVPQNGPERWISSQLHPVFGDDGKILNIIGFSTDVTKQVESTAKLSEINSQFQNAFDYASHGMALVSTDGQFLRVNEALCNILGYEERKILDLTINKITHKDDLAFSMALMQELLEDKRPLFQLEERHIRANGSLVPVQLNVSLVRDAEKKPVHFVVQVQDLSELKQREEQLRQSQKMDAVGKLTGGIAHDFNNILGIILGNLEILDSSFKAEENQKKRLHKAIKSVDRGTNLIKKLLNFSRNTPRMTDVVMINDSINNFYEFIAKTLTVSIKVQTELAEDLWPVDIDAGEFEDAILNLALNARDAMVDGGTLTIKTENVTLDADYVRHITGSSVGDHVMVSVSDTGEGIDGSLIEKVLEPFFTTKPLNQGTGLGLSMVHGFVQRSGGHMRIQSDPNSGTDIRLYFPKSLRKIKTENTNTQSDMVLPKGDETILIVDDESHLCEVAERQLSHLGYSVFTASDTESAMDILNKNKNIDLLFSDIVMPDHQNGYKMANIAKKISPSLKILLTSGYSHEVEKRLKNDDKAMELRQNILQKPYNQKQLAIAVRRSLDGG